MYNDFRNTARETWKYTYKGEELLPHAERKFKGYLSKEVAARKRMFQLMMDMKARWGRRFGVESKEVTDCKSEIETSGNLGDVTFFGIPEPEGTLNASD